eukprot:7076879-Prymnesium_polylepis.1
MGGLPIGAQIGLGFITQGWAGYPSGPKFGWDSSTRDGWVTHRGPGLAGVHHPGLVGIARRRP